LSDLKEFNQTAPRFMTQELDRGQANGRPQKFFQAGDNVEILLILCRLWRCNANGRSQNALPLFTPL